MSEQGKLKTAAVVAGTMLATTMAWLGLRSHEEKQELEKERLQAEYMASRAQTMAHLDAQHQEVMNTIQELGQFNPQSNFSKRLRPNKPSYVETQTAQEQEQPLLNIPEV